MTEKAKLATLSMTNVNRAFKWLTWQSVIPDVLGTDPDSHIAAQLALYYRNFIIIDSASERNWEIGSDRGGLL